MKTQIIRIELFHWYHIVGVYNKNVGEMSLSLNGKKVRSLHGVNQPIVLSDTPVMIGLNREKMPAVEGRIRRGKWPSLFAIDGLIDEIRIYNSAISEDEIAVEYKKNKPADSQIRDKTIINRKLPVNPDNKPALFFGAEYKTLGYYETWDNLWRIGDYADIVINFDILPVNLVFWRGTSYGPYFVTENGKWIGDQSNEDYREFQHPGDAEGCLEHMSDKQCRHSHVRIIENNNARVLIHWRYGLVDSRYLFSPRNDGWGTWSDEYWTIYPDGVAIRHLARGKVFDDGWVETMFLSAPGTKPEDNTEIEASVESPIVNPAFVIKNWYGKRINLTIDGQDVKRGKKFRYGTEYDTFDQKFMVIWLEMHREDAVKFELEIRK